MNFTIIPPIKATIVFDTPTKKRGWSVTKMFNGDRHVDAFINYIERNKPGFKYDETYIH
jgi:hypothetical protein